MMRTIVLDTGPLGLVTSPKRTPETRAAARWLLDLMNAGHRIVVPAIADYEVRRELERLGRARSLMLLDAFNAAQPNRYLPLTDEALRLAAKLWAQARNAGTPTADPRELDCDVLIAAQALALGIPESELVVATVNVGHLSRFVSAVRWPDITP